MLNKLACALIAVLASCAGCAHTTPVTTKVSHVVDCTATQVKEQLPAVFTEVLTDLLSKDYVGLLTDIAKRVGDDVVVCAVKESAAAAESRASATPGVESPNADAIRANAAEYLRVREVKFAGASKN